MAQFLPQSDKAFVCAFVEQETMLENAIKIVSPDYGTSSKAMEVVSNQFLEHNFTCQ